MCSKNTISRAAEKLNINSESSNMVMRNKKKLNNGMPGARDQKHRPDKERRQYFIYKTCSICGVELPRTSMHICDSCTSFVRKKMQEDL